MNIPASLQALAIFAVAAVALVALRITEAGGYAPFEYVMALSGGAVLGIQIPAKQP